MRRAKIVCTIGPASHSKEVILSLIKNGMDVARMNFSHGDHESHRRAFDLVREGAERYNRPVAILQDLQGIKIRVGALKGGFLPLRKGDEILVQPGDGVGGEGKIYISYPGIARDAKRGDRILMDDGLMQVEVVAKRKNSLRARVIEGGILKERKGVNVPFPISAPAFTAKDAADLDFGVAMGVDYIALSFVRSAGDITKAKERLRKRKSDIPIIAKIEKPEALSNIEEILDAADGIMIARGDLGVEIPPEEVPLVQKDLINRSNRKGKIVITATQMLESMTEHSRPTRAEATDVANAVLDGTDALMLSGETASGRYPVEALKMMDRIITYTEKQSQTVRPPFRAEDIGHIGFSVAVADAACRAAEDIQAKFIIAFTHSGFTARLVSKFRPKTAIIAYTSKQRVQREMAILWGVLPKTMRLITNTDDMIREVERVLLSDRLARKGDRIVITASAPLLGTGKTNLLKLHTIGETAERL